MDPSTLFDRVYAADLDDALSPTALAALDALGISAEEYQDLCANGLLAMYLDTVGA